MHLNEVKLYKAYEYKFDDGDFLKLKQVEVLEQVKLKVQKNIIGNEIETSEISWYLNIAKEKTLKNHSLEVVSCISWHMGIPFYKVKFNDELYEVAEFYLE